MVYHVMNVIYICWKFQKNLNFMKIWVHLYTGQKKKRTTTIFPLRSPFNTKMLIAMKYSFLIKFN